MRYKCPPFPARFWGWGTKRLVCSLLLLVTWVRSFFCYKVPLLYLCYAMQPALGAAVLLSVGVASTCAALSWRLIVLYRV